MKKIKNKVILFNLFFKKNFQFALSFSLLLPFKIKIKNFSDHESIMSYRNFVHYKQLQNSIK